MFEPGSPTWKPQTEADIDSARTQGLLAERHHLDIKREIPAGAGGNKELAKDLASFAIDGGALVVGVEEALPTPLLHPVALRGLPERIEQVALQGVQEPLAVRTLVVPSDADPSKGFVVVIVPPSGSAPHMVDGRYYGRNDKTKYVLSDAEVTRLHSARLGRERNALDELTLEMDRTPLPNGFGTVMVRARPVSARDDLALPLTGATEWERELLELVHEATQATPALGHGGVSFSPDVTYGGISARRPNGIARTNNIAAGRTLAESEPRAMKRTLEVFIGDDGLISAFCGRATDVLSERPDRPNVAFELLIVGYAHRVVAMAGILAMRYGYYGGWDLCIGVDGLHGHTSWEIASAHFFEESYTYTDDEYKRAHRASLEELTQTPNAVVGALTAPLLRALGSAHLERFKSLIE
jgi:hypothetical protein